MSVLNEKLSVYMYMCMSSVHTVVVHMLLRLSACDLFVVCFWYQDVDVWYRGVTERLQHISDSPDSYNLTSAAITTLQVRGGRGERGKGGLSVCV